MPEAEIRGWSLLLWCFAAPAFGGLFGSDAPARIPVPAKVFQADVEDVGGTILRIDRASFDGEVFVYGTIGRAQVTVPFENVVTIEFLPGADADHRTATVQVRSGEPVSLVVEADRPIYGRTSFGNYRIDLEHVRRVTMAAVPPPG